MDKLTIMHFNKRALTNKLALMNAILKTFHKRPAVIVITETWLDNLNCHLFNIKGYTSYHLVRTTRTHGGVSIFVLDKIQSSQICKLTYIDENIEIDK